MIWCIVIAMTHLPFQCVSNFGFALGTPVICDGLKASTHLNGKIGDIRSYDEDIEGFKIYFEEEGLEPWPLKAKFLRILFELPEEF